MAMAERSMDWIAKCAAGRWFRGEGSVGGAGGERERECRCVRMSVGLGMPRVWRMRVNMWF